MKELTPELDTVLNKLVELCCDGMRDGEVVDPEQIDTLVALLHRHGWDRYAAGGPPLSVRLENRTQEACSHASKFHARQLQALTGQIERAYRDAARRAVMPQPKDD